MGAVWHWRCLGNPNEHRSTSASSRPAALRKATCNGHAHPIVLLKGLAVPPACELFSQPHLPAPPMKTSSNPTYSRSAIARLTVANASDGTVLTFPGIARKSLVLLTLVIASAAYTWRTAALHGPGAIMGAAAIGCIGGLVIALFTVYSPTAAPITAPIYAVLEGLAIGAISFLTNARY